MPATTAMITCAYRLVNRDLPRAGWPCGQVGVGLGMVRLVLGVVSVLWAVNRRGDGMPGAR
ncbi:hypothetical protein AA15973_2044 [Komagataeibacter sucrofermentans DSM 15973]|nr:hypothetical protein AA15973_2044 [Komagataeibacter sucrofermentans DSM 15973]